MRKAFILFLLILPILFASTASYGQNIAITDDSGYNADSSAMLDVKSATKGFLVPRMTTIQRNAIVNPATGLLVFDTDENGFFYFAESSWLNLSAVDVWSQTGSAVHLSDSTSKVGVGTSTPQNKLSVKGDATSGVNEAIFSVVSPNGDTLLAVYPEGTRIYVKDDPAKAAGSRSGFAVGGYSMSKGETNEYLRVTPDSVRVYIENSGAAKAASTKGGFAVGGFSLSKPPSDSLYLFSDQTGFNVNFLTEIERDAIVSPRISSIIFNTTDSCLQIFLGYWESIWCTPMGCVYPGIITEPANDSSGYDEGGSAAFGISATGSKVYYKWQESDAGSSIWRILEDGGTSPQYSGTHSDTLVMDNIPNNYNFKRYRCLVSNACGSEISTEATLIAGCGGPFTDARDSQVYNSVQIGDQCWMADNLNVGTMVISAGPGQQQYNNSINEKYCYSNVLVNCDDYGGLYEWGEMMQYGPSDNGNPGTTQGLCPAGMHIPTDTEWTELTTYLDNDGGKLKETGTVHWNSPNTGATNESGFTALPAGRRDASSGNFMAYGADGKFWTATEFGPGSIWHRWLQNINAGVDRVASDEMTGYSVRCIKD